MGRTKGDNIYLFADFETTVLDENNQTFNTIKEAKSRIYLWCMVDKYYNKVCHGEDIESFYKFIKQLNKNCYEINEEGKKRKEHNYIIYFHNLSKWDGGFIISYFLKRGIKFTKLSKLQTIYSLKWKNIEFRDSLNIINASVKKIGEEINTIYKKTSINYKVGFNHKPSDEEIEYCYNDCLVVAEGYNNFMKMVDEVFTELKLENAKEKAFKSLTISGIAFNGFIESSNYDKLCKNKSPLKYDTTLRKAYYGGFVYSNYKVGMYKGSVKMLDENSMYPDKYRRCYLPYGKPFIYTEDEYFMVRNFRFYIMDIKIISAKLKKGYPAIIPNSCKSFSNNGNYVEEIEEEYYTVSNIDFERWKRYYNLKYEVYCYYCFYTKPYFYKSWADELIKLKANSKGVKRFVVKQLLNAPYGKLAMNGLNVETEYYLNENETICERIISEEVDERSFKYLPQAIAITAYARDDLFSMCEKINWKYVLYCDTDSVKFMYDEKVHKLEELPNFDIDNSGKLGLWKLEGEPSIFKTIAPKKYIFYENGVIEFTSAGFRKDELALYFVNKFGGEICKDNKEHIKCDYETACKIIDNFTYNIKIPQLIKKRVNGGYILIDGEKEIKKPKEC